MWEARKSVRTLEMSVIMMSALLKAAYRETVPVSNTVDTLRNDADFLNKNGSVFASDQQYTFGHDQ